MTGYGVEPHATIAAAVKGDVEQLVQLLVSHKAGRNQAGIAAAAPADLPAAVMARAESVVVEK